MLSSAHVFSLPVVIWVRVLPASTPLVSTATGTLESLSSITQLPGIVVPPAVGCTAAVQRAHVPEPIAIWVRVLPARCRSCRPPPGHPSQRGSVAELSVEVSPQQYAAPVLSRTHMNRACADLGEGLTARTPLVFTATGTVERKRCFRRRARRPRSPQQ